MNGTTVDFTHFSNTVAGVPRGSNDVHHGVNPSDGKQLWDVPIASAGDLDDAVKAAQKAFKTWSKTTWAERQAILLKMAEETEKYGKELGDLVMIEGGKPPPFATGEAMGAAAGLKYYGTLEDLGEETVEDDPEKLVVMRHVPKGVVGAILPWNFPLIIAINKIGPALLTGNCIIVKPSPFTPYSILKLAEILQQFLPPGVLQAMNGDDTMGPMMCEHLGIQKITFTGSSATGKKVMASSARTLKDVTLELGGNSASIICPDVDVSKIASQVALGAFYNSGQLCVASKRLYVHQDIYQDFKKALVEAVKSWKTGPTSEEGIMLGPVQNKMQHQIVKEFFEDCASSGYDFALEGGKIGEGNGFVIQPAIIDNPPDSARIVREEQFGPIVPMLTWSSESDLIARVNDTQTGLGGAVWSSDLDRAQRIARQIEAGTIWINSFEKPLAQAYFSGHKESGIGGEGGKLGLYHYVNTQVIHMYRGDVGKAKL
ncbi:aldehyde dehydrogenase [Halenospora varia]|nr:aldehyde dehydrogenase [Halenospora varia]